VRQFFDDCIDDQVARALVRRANDQAALEAWTRGGVVVVAGTAPMLAGTAYDFGFRDWLQPFRVVEPPRMALHGAQHARAVGWPKATRQLAAILRTLPDTDALGKARRYVALAVFERFARALGAILAQRGNAGDDLPGQMLSDPPATLADLLDRMPEATVRDVAAVLDATQHRWPRLRDLPFVANPIFPLSAQIGGADADWISGGMLYECKLSYVARPVAGKHLRQLLGYLLLDHEDALAITAVALFLPRQGACLAWDTAAFLRGLGIRGELPALRARFAIVVAALPQPEPTVERLTITDPANGQEHRVLRTRVRRTPPTDPTPS